MDRVPLPLSVLFTIPRSSASTNIVLVDANAPQYEIFREGRRLCMEAAIFKLSKQTRLHEISPDLCAAVMADDGRLPQSALQRRRDQINRWLESDTNRAADSPSFSNRKVKFQDGCVFLAACSSGDRDEVLRLLDKGADINTANIDGLTALHQVKYNKTNVKVCGKQ